MYIGFYLAGLYVDKYKVGEAGHDWPTIWLFPCLFAAGVADVIRESLGKLADPAGKLHFPAYSVALLTLGIKSIVGISTKQLGIHVIAFDGSFHALQLI